MVPRRYYYLLAAFLIIVIFLISYPKSKAHLDATDLFTGERWFFEDDNAQYAAPAYNVEQLTRYKPHNYHGAGHATVATFFASRGGSLQDPYFLAAQQQLYRVLWDPRSRSRHPMTIFVAPFVSETQRRILQAAGAHVKEVSMIEWRPLKEIEASKRYRDQFTKLNFWGQTEFSKIMYLDVDAFPLEHFDVLLDSMAEDRACEPTKLPKEDRVDVEEMCNYTFMATKDRQKFLNAGMFVIRPNEAMHAHLLRGMNRDRNLYENKQIEQGYLMHVFREDGPFPAQWIDRAWNAIETTAEDAGKVHIVHEKIWAFDLLPDHWAYSYFNDTWIDMLKLYESPEFAKLRAEDGLFS